MDIYICVYGYMDIYICECVYVCVKEGSEPGVCGPPFPHITSLSPPSKPIFSPV